MVGELGESMRRQIRRLSREGLGVTAIANVCGVSRPTVRKYLELDIDAEKSVTGSTAASQEGYATAERESDRGLFDVCDDRRPTA